MANSDKRVIWTDSVTGFVCTLTPSDNCKRTVEEIAKKDVPDGETYYILNTTDVPTDDIYWEAINYSPSEGFTYNISKAKEVQKNLIRMVREPKLQELDIQFQRALETGESTSDIVANKQKLRDATENGALINANTIAEIKASWDTSILGSSPYS